MIKLNSILFAIMLSISFTYAQEITMENHDSIKIYRDISYSKINKKETLLLDLFKSQFADSSLTPTIICIRGGGWKVGDKYGFGNISKHLALKGFNTICIQYRTGPYPQSIFDVKNAIKWVKTEGLNYGLDTSSIFLVGGSAGGHLALFCGNTSSEKQFTPKGNFKNYHVKGIVSMAGPTSLPDIQKLPSVEAWIGKSFSEDSITWVKASPTTYVSKNSPPTLFIHSNKDNIVPLEQSEIMIEKLKSYQITHKLFIQDGASHAFWYDHRYFNTTITQIEKFIHKISK